ncbi:L-serine ammonia-lyase, iron-sulfur-dependent, subunit alpha [Nocardiopsis sp. DSM 44743]|uniref:L-serine ammonia-lyase, iron-sulfur-dependent, subunit alpha n=1 Tax=Nocardiopsis lambiniae TaxID=3075539 RepID=A0ABU2MEH4_9ACTN|nr:L-serine ammonia-lyase, iron-sulfur-dependent, subunit alpha [Nocardiopsis sp. DSM 44743]MDT0331097.1 L-serine ammonia-lyase, iron-sulfur-dependent, subunit alpha [Nocardiopsis sp. DSM 44743]
MLAPFQGTTHRQNTRGCPNAGRGCGSVSLDKVIKAIRDTGRDMHDKYKETGRGGLAANVIEC